MTDHIDRRDCLTTLMGMSFIPFIPSADKELTVDLTKKEDVQRCRVLVGVRAGQHETSPPWYTFNSIRYSQVQWANGLCCEGKVIAFAVPMFCFKDGTSVPPGIASDVLPWEVEIIWHYIPTTVRRKQ